ncbi:tRNA synthetases class II family protein [Mycobacterium xenopi 4042]|uniref:tRNA synthetases class II family protein n=1 Tax=Mycobacterium xenopi 4042 TaxID=1299334 RepID=X7ZX96_MYCXE|nr:tRNA synthetases class II family protein [Mycobacterium xenopi 4042]
MNEESRVRQRYVDLIVRPQARAVARLRVAVVRAIRAGLEARGFLEVETPMLQTLAGGAAARPFVTHSNALDIDLYLRIAPELFLKRCVVGALTRCSNLIACSEMRELIPLILRNFPCWRPTRRMEPMTIRP